MNTEPQPKHLPNVEPGVKRYTTREVADKVNHWATNGPWITEEDYDALEQRVRELEAGDANMQEAVKDLLASLREQEELLQWAERVEEGITIQFEAREMTGVVAWTGEHVATTPTILAALRALRERVALCPERITPYEPKPPLHQI